MPHIQKLNGVIRTARAVLIALSDTDNSMFAFESELMKLEMFPPGHEATRIIPMAMVQLMLLPNANASRHVNMGSRTSWQSIPTKMGLGFLNRFRNVLGLMPSATPYMTKARMMLTVFIPPALSVTEMPSILLISSGDKVLKF